MPLIVLGIDPGTRHLGWGVVDAQGAKVKHVAHGVIHAAAELALSDRLVKIDDELEAVISEYAPREAAVESIFFSRDPQAAAKLGHARGVVLLRIAKAGVTFAEYAPAHIKRAIVGGGMADKRQVALVVKAILALSAAPASDAADALAIAITHARASRIPQLIRRARS